MRHPLSNFRIARDFLDSPQDPSKTPTRGVWLIRAIACLMPACLPPAAANCPEPDNPLANDSDDDDEPLGEGDEAEDASTSPVELVVCHPQGVYAYTSESSEQAEGFACSLYDRAGINTLLTKDVEGVAYPSLSEALDNVSVEGTAEYIYIFDQPTLDWLSDSDKKALAAAFAAGSPVGLGGTDEAALTGALGLPEGHAGVLPDARTAHFVHRSNDAIEHLAVELPYYDTFAEVLGEVMDWEEEDRAANLRAEPRPEKSEPSAAYEPASGSSAGFGFGYVAADAMGSSAPWDRADLTLMSSTEVDSGWHYCKNYSYSGKVEDDDKDRGGYNLDFTFYYVTSSEVDDDMNRWLVVSELTSSMSEYYTNDSNKKKGYYMRNMALEATLNQYNGDIDEWSPSTTVDSSSTSSTIGATISKNGLTGSYSVTTSNTTQDVEIEVDGDLSNNDGVGGEDWVKWNVKFDRCGTNSSDTKLKDPAAAAQGLWSEQLALYTTNDDNGEGIHIQMVPYFRVEHCKCQTTSCPIRASTTYYPFGTSGTDFQVFTDTCS